MAFLLADARLPSGAHAHSGGVEQAVDDGVVTDLDSLAPFLLGRLHTSGRLGAAVAANACALAAGCEAGHVAVWTQLDAEVTARVVAPALRATSRRQGRSLLNTGQRMVDGIGLRSVSQSAPEGPHLAVVQGALAAACGLAPSEAAVIAAYGTVATAASAALRLLGLDPVSVAAALADLAEEIDRITAEATASASADVRSLPAPASPMTDYLAERHGARRERLFAS
jgi:urease accessory protein